MKGKVFNAQEVQSILAGNKRMFREVIARNTRLGDSLFLNNYILEEAVESFCPYQVGQKIFYKESFSISQYFGDKSVRYWASGESELEGWSKPKPAQHMKQEHSRITLHIKDISVERLQSISEEDCYKEGIRGFYNEDLSAGCGEAWESKTEDYLRKWLFKKPWNVTHKKPEEKFEANPWIWKIEVEVVK